MKALIPVFVLLISSIGLPQTSHSTQKDATAKCSTILRVNTVRYATTKDETIDTVTLCADGKITALHSFRAPAFGETPPQPTKWDYTNEIDKNALSDVKAILLRTEITGLAEQVNAVKTPSPLDGLMRFTFVDHDAERAITLQVPSVGCGEAPEMPKAVWELICLFSDLHSRAKTGTPPQEGCGCKALHEMAVADHAESR
jgi:hypothetical protein